MSGKSSEISLAVRLRKYLSLTALGVGICGFLAFGTLVIAFVQQERRTSVQTLGSALARLISRPLSQNDYYKVEDSLRGANLPEFVTGVEVVTRTGEKIAIGREVQEANSELRFSLESPNEFLQPTLVMHWSNGDLVGKFVFWSLIALLSSVPLYVVIRWVTSTGIALSIRPLQKSVDAAASDGSILSNVLKDAPIEIRPVVERLTRIQDEMARERLDAELGRLSSQLAHDLRSPLTALDLLLSSLSALPETERLLLRSSIHRMRDICHSLLVTTKSALNRSGPEIGATKVEAELLGPLIEAVVAEIRMRFHGRVGTKISYPNPRQAFGIFSRIDRGEFQRVISNLIGNAAEAIEESGEVTVSIGLEGASTAFVRIQDTGRGIPGDVLRRLGERGYTFGKQGGIGLGLWSCKQSIESWGGSLTIESELGKGTLAVVRLQGASEPSWFAREIRVPVDCEVAVLDDDQSIHQVWAERLQGGARNPLSFSDVKSFRSFVQKRSRGTFLFLLDYEMLESSKNGLDLIEELGIDRQSLLVTSHFDEPALQARAIELNVKVLPKSFAAFVPIIYEVESKVAERDSQVVLIDNDALVRSAWKYSAERSGRNLRVFASASEFLGGIDEFSRGTTIYIDQYLDGGVLGHEFAKDLHGAGFTSLYIATGERRDRIPLSPWIAGVVGKEVPWGWSQ